MKNLFSRRHYIFIRKYILKQPYSHFQKVVALEFLADMFEKDSPKFKRDKFVMQRDRQ